MAMAHEDDLYELLKTANPNKATSTGDTEERSTVGVTQLYEDPVNRPEGVPESPWGERSTTQDGHPQPDHNTDGVWAEHQKVRQGVLRGALSGFDAAAKAEQKLIAENFVHGANGNFTSSYPLLQSKSKEKISHVRSETLLQQVRRVAGRE
jgi:hypothetical protein